MLLEEAWVTALECIYGFLLAMGIGIPIAVVMTYSRIANLMFYPLLVASQSIPKVAVAPILLVWFGTGIESQTGHGLRDRVLSGRGRHRDRAALDLAGAARAGAFAAMLAAADLLQDPAAVGIAVDLLGAKIAVTLAVIGAVIGEFIGSNQGLGNLLLTANSQLNTPLVWASLVVLSVLGMVLYGAVVLAEKILMPWGPDSGHKL